MYNTEENGYYKIVRLKTGENILCTMDRDLKTPAAETHIQMNVPVQVVPHKETRRGNQIIGESFILRPWMGLSDSEEFYVSTDIILTIGDLKRDVKQQYINYVTQAQETKQRVEDSYAAEMLLREITPGELKIIDLEGENNHGTQEYEGE